MDRDVPVTIVPHLGGAIVICPEGCVELRLPEGDEPRQPEPDVPELDIPELLTEQPEDDLVVLEDDRSRPDRPVLIGEKKWVVHPPEEIKPPCYFNTGCCAFGDGDATGIEIADGEIRLVRWPDNDGHALPEVLEHEPLAEMFERVRAYEARQG